MYALLNLRLLDAFGLAVGSWIFYKILRTARCRAKTTKLRGPPAKSWLFGVSKQVFEGDAAKLFEGWATEYGAVYQVPGPLGDRRTVLTDPKAVAHFYSKETMTYVKNEFTKQLIASVLGKGILWAEGEDHKRQRKSLNTCFTNAAIRDLTSIFYESVDKVKTAWDLLLSGSPNGEAIIDVQKWMNCVSLDTIGIAAFGYDFGALQGKNSDVEAAFDALGTVPPVGIDVVLGLLGPVFPIVTKIPTKRMAVLQKLDRSMQEIAENLLQRSRKDSEAGILSRSSRSIMGALIRAESAAVRSTLTEEEVIGQMKTLMLAGYETTSISLTRALIELSLRPEKQDRLRKEVLDFGEKDPSYDQLANELPYLDAVLRETLRLHPPVQATNRVALHDDVIPLSEPVKTLSGEIVDRITIGADAPLMIPIRAINRSEAIWGSDAKEFKPERWLNKESGLTSKAKEIQGFHHLLSFIDGPRICLGRLFAVAEFKAVLSVLIRNYLFEMRDGPLTKVMDVTTILQRPKVEGEEGYSMPMRVRHFEG